MCGGFQEGGGALRAAESTQSPRPPSLLPGLQALQHQRRLGLGFLQEAGDALAGLTDTGPCQCDPAPIPHHQAQTQASVILPLQPTTHLPAQAPCQRPVPSGHAPWPILSGVTPSSRPGAPQLLTGLSARMGGSLSLSRGGRTTRPKSPTVLVFPREPPLQRAGLWPQAQRGFVQPVC